MRSSRLRPGAHELVLAVCGLAAALSLWLLPPPIVATGDERDYLRAAVHQARSGVHASAPVSVVAPRPDAYREPGYPFLLALTWRLSGAPLPVGEANGSPELSDETVRGLRRLGALLLVATAAAAGLAASFAGASRRASLAAAVLVLASPALRQAALTAGSEGLAAALLTAAACGLIVAVTRGALGAVALAGLGVGLGPLVRGAAIVLVPVGVALLLWAPRGLPTAQRVRRAALFLLLALAPPLGWMSRNLRATGHFVLGDRGGQVMWSRAELDRQVAGEGLLPALCAWTPIDAVRRAGERRWPEATYSRYAWTGVGNFFTRSLNSWHEARRPPADPIEVDRSFGKAALAEFVRRPGAHFVAGVAVAWRGLFAERSPELLSPIDLTFAFGLVSALTVILVAARALRSGRIAPIALLAGPIALFLFHAAATEFLTRFSVPALALVWAALPLALSSRSGAGAGPAVRDGTVPDDRFSGTGDGARTG